MRKSDLFFNVLRLPIDFLMLLAAGLTTYIFRTEILSAFRPVLFEFNLPLLEYIYLVVFVSLLFLGSFALSGLYSMRFRMGYGEEFFKIVIASSAGIMMVIIYIFLRQELFNSRFLVMGGWFFAIVFTFIGRVLIRWIRSFAEHRYDYGANRLILIGRGDIASKIETEIKNDPRSGYRIVGQFDRSEFKELTRSISDNNADEVIMADLDFPADYINDVISLCQERHINFKFVPHVSGFFGNNLESQIFRGFALIEIKRTNLEGWGRVIKRVIDTICSLLGLVVLSPLFAMIAFAIKWETEGPVFIRQERISGKDKFLLYKFRSMIDGADALLAQLIAKNERGGPLFKIKDDPRITKVGKFIRRTRLDELAQLFNVLRGDISLVGPRPHRPHEISKYENHHKKVLAIKGGITGLAQVSGSSDLDFEKEVILDSFYIDNWSLWLDIKIIFKTLLKMLMDKSAV